MADFIAGLVEDISEAARLELDGKRAHRWAWWGTEGRTSGALVSWQRCESCGAVRKFGERRGACSGRTA